MKKMLCLILSILMCVLLTSCNNPQPDDKDVSSNAPTSSTVNVDIADLASKGKIDGCKFTIGDNPEEIKKDYHYGDDEYWGTNDEVNSRYNIDADTLEIREGDPVRMMASDSKLYYRVADVDKGISFIAYFYDAYTLRIGISDTQTVKDAVNATPAYDDFAKSEDLFFLFGEPTDVYMISYSFGDYYLSFYFENGKLSATTIKSISVWG